MKTKNIIRLCILAGAVLAAAIIILISAGVFKFMSNGYNVYFDYNDYIKREMFLDDEVSVTNGKAVFESVSAFDKNVTITQDVVMDCKTENGKTTVTLTIKNSVTLVSGTFFTCVPIEKHGTTLNKENFADIRQTKVSVNSGENVYDLTLESAIFNKRSQTFIYSYDGELSVDKITLTGFYLTQFNKR